MCPGEHHPHQEWVKVTVTRLRHAEKYNCQCPSVTEWIRNCSTFTVERYAAERKKELPPFMTAWMELESIMLSEVSQALKTNTI